MLGNIQIDGARIRFLNFEGREGMYNRPGDRNFCVFIDAALAEQLNADGWNVKTLKARNADEQDQDYLEVSVKYQGRNGPVRRPPRVVLITSRGRTDLDEDTCGLMDISDIRNVDLIIRPNEWEVNGKTGIKAYLKSCFATLEEDALELRYAHVPVIGAAEEPPAISARQQVELDSKPHYDFEGELA